MPHLPARKALLTLPLLSLFPHLASGAQQSAPEAPIKEEPLEVIEVTGSGSQVDLTKSFAGGQVARGGRAGLFGNLDFMNSPFAGLAYTEQLIDKQQAQNIGDVLQNDPTVRVTKGFGNFQEVYMLRGFPVFSDDLTLNGVYGILPRQFVAAELIERVEVFRGANAFINGAAPGGSGVGGSINLVTKRAPVGGVSTASIEYDANNVLAGALDVGRRYGADDEWGVRANAVVREGETAIDGQDQQLSVFSLGGDYNGDKLRVSADLGFQDNRLDAPRPQITPLGAIPAVPDADANFAQPWTFSEEEQLFGVVRGEYDLTDTTAIWLGAGFREGEENNDLANPNIAENGEGTAIRFVNTREDSIYSVDAGLRSEYQLGDITNQVVVSGSLIDLESKNAFAFADFAGFATNIYNPQAVAPPATDAFIGGDLNNPLVTEATKNHSFAVANTAALFDSRLLATVGVRFQHIDTRSFNAADGTQTGAYDDNDITPIAGLVYKYSPTVSVYANYAQSIQPGATAPSSSNGEPVTNAGEVLAPFAGDQYELGVKYDGQTVGATANLFTLSRPNAIIEQQIFTADGEQRTRGIELSVFGEPMDGLRIVGGGTYLDAELTKTQAGVDEGNSPIGIPELQTNLNVEWDIAAIDGLAVDGRWIYTGEQYINTANSVELDDWHRFDIGVSYGFVLRDTLVDVRARINNVTDNDYWASTGGFPGANYLIMGEPRTVSVSAMFSF